MGKIIKLENAIIKTTSLPTDFVISYWVEDKYIETPLVSYFLMIQGKMLAYIVSTDTYYILHYKREEIDSVYDKMERANCNHLIIDAESAFTMSDNSGEVKYRLNEIVLVREDKENPMNPLNFCRILGFNMLGDSLVLLRKGEAGEMEIVEKSWEDVARHITKDELDRLNVNFSLFSKKENELVREKSLAYYLYEKYQSSLKFAESYLGTSMRFLARAEQMEIAIEEGRA